MRTELRLIGMGFAIGLCALSSACGPRYVQGTEVEYSPEKAEIAQVIERYRQAVVLRDTQALRELTSDGYYENGSTTVDAADDYDRSGFEKVLSQLKENVKAVKYDIEIADIEVKATMARVDYSYKGHYLYVVAGQERWKTAADKNRITLRKEGSTWRILSGM